MSNHSDNPLLRVQTTFGSLLCELKTIWDEIGEPESERDRMLLEIEQECVRVYTSKVDEAKECRSTLQEAVATAEAEIVEICKSLGEKLVHGDKMPGQNLKENLETVIPLVEAIRRKKDERRKLFVEVLNQILKISNEISGVAENMQPKVAVDETDLSLRKLEGLHKELQDLQDEKSKRLNQVEDYLDTLSFLCLVLVMDFKDMVHKIHPTLINHKKAKDVSSNTISKLASKIQTLRELKIQRMEKIQDLATALLELWLFIDTPLQEQYPFQKFTNKIAASEHEVTEPNVLSLSNIKKVEEEVFRLERLKSGKMKEVILRKKIELEEMCRRTHMVTDALTSTDFTSEAISSGAEDPVYLLKQIELQISNVKEVASSRKGILERVEKWLAACEEESWLEEYNWDDNRYNAGRGVHLNLKRAEKARVVVNKIPAMVETLTSKTMAWEKERGHEFSYDGRRLLSIFEDYRSLREEKELERQRQRDQKRLQGQLMAEQEAIYGSKPSPTKSAMKSSRTPASVTSNRKLSLGGAMLQNIKPDRTALRRQSSKRIDHLSQSTQSGQPKSADAGRRISEIPGRIVKKPSSTTAAKELQTVSAAARKPLSPVSFSVSSKANILDFFDDEKKQSGANAIFSGCKTLPDEHANSTSNASNENWMTPKRVPPVQMPATPSTVSVPMVVALTPATPAYFTAKKLEKLMEPVEYSFEEFRAGSLSQKTHSIPQESQ